MSGSAPAYTVASLLGEQSAKSKLIIGRHYVGQLFFSAAEELDPTLPAVVLGRPRLGSKI